MTAKHRRGPWSQAEDGYLLQLVHTQGAHNWVRISQLIQSRSPKQCRERYHQNLKPSLNLNPITPEEGILIERMVAEMGKRWAEIARRLHGRSDNAVKNWWNGGMNRRKRFDNRRADPASNQSQSQYRNTSHLETSLHSMKNESANMPSTSRRPVEMRHNNHPMPPPLETNHLKPSIRTNLIETPLPSPSAISNMSHDDSSEGAPPSLVSDSGTYSAYSQSPHTSAHNSELPPLTAVANEHRHHMLVPHLQRNGQPFGSEKPRQYQAPFYAYPGGFQSNHHHWHQHTPVLPSQSRSSQLQNQVALPNFRTVVAPPSPPRDSRMALSNVID